MTALPNFNVRPAADVIAELIAGRGYARKVELFEKAVVSLQEALGRGTIPNVTYGYLTSTINDAIETAWTALPGNDYDCPYPTIHTTAGLLKKLQKAGNTTDRTTFLTTILPLTSAMKWFKDGEGRIVKRQPKAPEDVKEKYLAPRAGNDARALVQRALTEVVDKQFFGLVRSFVLHYNREIGALLDDLKGPLPADGIIRSEHVRLHCRLRQGRSRRTVNTSLDLWVDLTPEARHDAIRERATKEAQEIRDNFVIKNLQKLDSIIEAKGNFDAIRVVGHTLSLGSLEGHFVISFKDGASFAVRNSIVFVENQNGTRFPRFPLTFHDVYLPEGKLTAPSEERMNTVFVGKVPR